MFKTVSLYRLDADIPDSAHGLEELMKAAMFVACGPTQTVSAGWIPPRVEHGALIESVGSQWICKIQIEAKVLPASVVNRLVDKMAKKYEADTGRKPGTKLRKDMKEEAYLTLLPQAFTKLSTVSAWIDPLAMTVALDSTADKKCDLMLGALSGLGFKTRFLQTKTPPVTGMSAWLLQGYAEAGFSLGRECELKQPGGEGAAVHYTQHSLENDGVIEHIRQGKLPTKLALEYDDRVSFTLLESGQLTKIEILDVVFTTTTRAEGADEFDANVAIFTGQMRPLFAGLLEVLDGELVSAPMEPVTGAAQAPQAGVQAAASALDTLMREGGTTATLQARDGEVIAHFGDGPDPMYEQAVAIVKAEQKASISLVQRHLKIGYNRAARLLERMEKDGLISLSPMQGDGSRVLVAQAAAA